MIPPSAMAVILCSIGEISIGKTLIAIIIPGLLMATLYVACVIGRCRLQPSIAPAYDVILPSLSERLVATVKYILPLALIIFLVIGVIFIGVATPSEATATGAIGTFILVVCYRKLNWETLKKSTSGTLVVTVMVLIIITVTKAFSQILAFSGGCRGKSAT